MTKQKRTRKIGYSVDAIFVRSPETVLREAIEKGNWFEGVVLSKVYLEGCAIDRLRRYLNSKKVRGRLFVHRMKLHRASRILEELGIIDDKTHSLIGEINAYRNKLLYEIRTPDALKPEKAKDIIQKALRCLEAIASSYKSV